MARFEPNTTAYIVESGMSIREVQVERFSGGLYTVRFPETGGGIQIRESRLFATKEEAEAVLPKKKPRRPM